MKKKFIRGTILGMVLFFGGCVVANELPKTPPPADWQFFLVLGMVVSGAFFFVWNICRWGQADTSAQLIARDAVDRAKACARLKEDPVAFQWEVVSALRVAAMKLDRELWAEYWKDEMSIEITLTGETEDGLKTFRGGCEPGRVEVMKPAERKS